MGKPERAPQSTFAERLLYARTVWELGHGSPDESDGELAHRARVSTGWVKKWKDEPTYEGQSPEIARLATALGCSTDWLTGSPSATPPLPAQWGSWIIARRLGLRSEEAMARPHGDEKTKAARGKAAKNAGA